MLSFPFDSANKWAKPVRPFQAALPAVRLALPSMKSMYSTTFPLCAAFTILYLTLVLGNVHGFLSRWHASLDLALEKRKESAAEDSDDSSPVDSSMGSRAGMAATAVLIKRLQMIVKVVVLLGTIVLLPGIVQAFVMAVDCSKGPENSTAFNRSMLVWDRDPTVECFVGDHADSYAKPAMVLLPLYLFVALRLSKAAVCSAELASS